MTPKDLETCKTENQQAMMTEFLCFVRLQGGLDTEKFTRLLFHIENDACESAIMQLIDTDYGVDLRAGGYDAHIMQGVGAHVASADTPALALGAAYIRRYMQ